MAKGKKAVAIDNNTLSLDLGYSSSKAFYMLNGKEVLYKIPTAVRELPEDTKEDDYLEYEGKKYLVGDRAIRYDIEIELDAETLIKNAPLFVYEAIKSKNIDHEGLTLTTGLSIKDFDSAKELAEKLKSFTVNGEEINLDVEVLPQGRGIGYDYFNDKSGREMPDIVLILDIGYNTFDFICLENGKMILDSSFANDFGVNRVLSEIQGRLAAEYDIERSTSELIKIILKNKILSHNGKKIDISNMFQEVLEKYVRDIKTYCISGKEKRSLIERADTILFGGGGTYMIKELGGKKISEVFGREEVDFVDEPYEYSNARGYYIRHTQE